MKTQTLFGWDGEKHRDFSGLSQLFPLEGVTVKVANYHYDFLLNEEGQYEPFKVFLGTQEDRDARLKEMLDILHHPRVVGAYCEGGKLVVTCAPKPGEWLGWLKDQGVEVSQSRKLMKRLKNIGWFLLTGRYKQGEIRIKVEGPDSPVVDGAFDIRESVVEKLSQGFKGTPGKEDRNRLHRKRLDKASSFTARIFYEDGELKGVAFVVPDSHWIHGECDIYSNSINLKKEISWKGGVAIGLTPQSHQKKANTSLQVLLNIPFLQGLLPSMIEAHFKKVREDILSGKPLEDVEDLARQMAEMAESGEDIESSPMLQRRIQMLIFSQTGHHLGHSRYLPKQAFDASVGTIIHDTKRDRISLPIYLKGKVDSLYAQVISVSQWRNLGLGKKTSPLPVVEPKSQEIMWCPEFQLGVVSDATWLYNCDKNWDTADHDDHFNLIFFRDSNAGGEMRVLVIRTPNQMGQYSLLKPMGSFPIHKLDEGFGIPSSSLPPQASKTEWLGEAPKKGEAYSGEPNKKWVEWQLRKQVEGTNPGGYVNAVMLYTHVTGHAPTNYPVTLSEAVDALKQECDLAGVKRMVKYQDSILEQVIKTQKPVDQEFSRRFGEETPVIRCKDGKWRAMKLSKQWITLAREQVEKEKKDSLAFILTNLKMEMPKELESSDPTLVRRVEPIFSWASGEVGKTVRAAMTLEKQLKEEGWKLKDIKKKRGLLESKRYSEIKKVLEERLGGDLEMVRAFAHLTFTRPSIVDGKLKLRSDFLLLSNTSKDEGLWRYYRRILEGEGYNPPTASKPGEGFRDDEADYIL